MRWLGMKAIVETLAATAEQLLTGADPCATLSDAAAALGGASDALGVLVASARGKWLWGPEAAERRAVVEAEPRQRLEFFVTAVEVRPRKAFSAAALPRPRAVGVAAPAHQIVFKS